MQRYHIRSVVLARKRYLDYVRLSWSDWIGRVGWVRLDFKTHKIHSGIYNISKKTRTSQGHRFPEEYLYTDGQTHHDNSHLAYGRWRKMI